MRTVVAPGASADRWRKVWAERHPATPWEVHHAPAASHRAALAEGSADTAFARLPVDGTVAGILGWDGYHAVRLWREETVVVVGKDHPIAAAESITMAELLTLLGDDGLIVPDDDVLALAATDHGAADTGLAVAMAAAGDAGVIVPLSLARIHHRRDVVAIPVTDAPQSSIGLVWREDTEHPLTQDLVGILRGRRASSSR